MDVFKTNKCSYEHKKQSKAVLSYVHPEGHFTYHTAQVLDFRMLGHIPT